MAKHYNPVITTGFGKAEWAHIVTPDTKFNPEGDFKMNLKMTGKDADDLMAQIQAEKEKALEFYIQEAKDQGAKPRAIEKIKLSDIDPYVEDEDEDGVFVFKFKRKAKYVDDTGETVHFKVDLVDAAGKTIPDEKKPKIGNGSVVRVQTELVRYNMPTSGVGVSLRFKSVQIKTLETYEGAGGGFDAIDDDGGYRAPADEGFGNAEDAYAENNYTV